MSQAQQSFIDTQMPQSHTFIKDEIVEGKEPTVDLDIAKHYEVSQFALEGYVTLDAQHYEEIEERLEVIRQYAQDRSRSSPLNILLHAEPGSGKSYFVKCLARKMSEDRIREVVFNMASMQDANDMVEAIDEVRNLKVDDKLPLLFLDEFDSHPKNFSLLLPLLWDGNIKGRTTGKMVIVLAGSKDRITRFIKNPGMKPNEEDGKIKDLLSRINGGILTIPDLDDTTGTRNRKVDKVCLTISLLRKRFGSSLVKVPWALLRFVADTKFRHGARSIFTFIDLIPPMDESVDSLQVKHLDPIFKSPKALESTNFVRHIEMKANKPQQVIDSWNKLASCKVLVKCAHPESIFSRGLNALAKEFKWGR